MHLKVFVKLEKPLKTLPSGQKTPKKPKKTQKTQKNPKKPTGLGFFKKPRFFPTLDAAGAHRGGSQRGRPGYVDDPSQRGVDGAPTHHLGEEDLERGAG